MKRDEIKRLLPGTYQSALRPHSPLEALLLVMEGLHAPTDELLGRIESMFSPYRSPDQFVPYLSRWVDLDRFFLIPGKPAAAGGITADVLSSGHGRLRELLAAAAYLSQWRGTREGLCCFLETATGIDGFSIDEQIRDSEGVVRPFHIRITAPQACIRHRTLIERIIEQEKPAYVTYELAFE